MENYNDYRWLIDKIVKLIISRYAQFTLSAEDLYQRGWLEVLKAEGRYNSDYDVKFTTYAYKSVLEGINDEAIFQINRSGVTRKANITYADYISVDDEETENIMYRLQKYENVTEYEETDILEHIQLLTETEQKVMNLAYGIDCERMSSAKKIANELNMFEFEVKKALESGKRKLKELSDGR